MKLSLMIAVLMSSATYSMDYGKLRVRESYDYKPIHVQEIEGVWGEEYLLIKKIDCSELRTLICKQDAGLDNFTKVRDELKGAHIVNAALNQRIKTRDETIESLNKKIKLLKKTLRDTQEDLEKAVHDRRVNLETLNCLIEHLHDIDLKDSSRSTSSRSSSSLTNSPSALFLTEDALKTLQDN